MTAALPDQLRQFRPAELLKLAIQRVALAHGYSETDCDMATLAIRLRNPDDPSYTRSAVVTPIGSDSPLDQLVNLQTAMGDTEQRLSEDLGLT